MIAQERTVSLLRVALQSYIVTGRLICALESGEIIAGNTRDNSPVTASLTAVTASAAATLHHPLQRAERAHQRWSLANALIAAILRLVARRSDVIICVSWMEVETESRAPYTENMKCVVCCLSRWGC